MIFLIGLATTALLAGCFTFFTDRPKTTRVIHRMYRKLFEEAFLEPIMGKRPDPWSIDWSTICYSRYQFSEELTNYIKELAVQDYKTCQLYNRGMKYDIRAHCPYGMVNEIYRVVPHMMRQGYYWGLYDPIRWRYTYAAWYMYTLLKDSKMDRDMEQRWKYEVYLQQPRKGGLYQKAFGESLPPNNYPHKGEMIFDYFPSYDDWYGPSSNDPSKLHLEVTSPYRKAFLDDLPWFTQKRPYIYRKYGRDFYV
jgi:hypothetical protein